MIFSNGFMHHTPFTWQFVKGQGERSRIAQVGVEDATVPALENVFREFANARGGVAVVPPLRRRVHNLHADDAFHRLLWFAVHAYNNEGDIEHAVACVREAIQTRIDIHAR